MEHLCHNHPTNDISSQQHVPEHDTHPWLGVNEHLITCNRVGGALSTIHQHIAMDTDVEHQCIEQCRLRGTDKCTVVAFLLQLNTVCGHNFFLANCMHACMH